MKCSKCLNDVPDGNFCDLCGTELKDKSQKYTDDFFNDALTTILPGPEKPVSKRRYSLICELGRGGMGIVYKAFDEVEKKYVAVKEMSNVSVIPSRELEKIILKLKKITDFNHPNIIKVFDCSFEDGKLKIIMEFFESKNLMQILDERGKLSLNQTSLIIKQLCDAVEYAHSKNIVHRDIKPSNILISDEWGLKLTDFDIACEIRNTITMLTGHPVEGTPLYMAPEQHLGRYSYKSDIYSIGVLIYELLTGKPPFKGTHIDIIYQKEKKAYTPLNQIVPELPQNITEMINKALEPDENLRPDLYEIKGNFI